MGTVHSGQLQDRKNMAKFLILSACLALSTAAPFAPLAAPLANHGLVGHAHLGHGLVGHAGIVGTHVVPGPTAVHEQVHHGAPVEHRRTITGVVGHRQIQVGTQAVQVGHEFHQTGEVANARPSYQVVASPATNQARTRALPLPPLPAPAAPGPIPAPIQAYGPAPADAVTTVAVKAPVRTHTVITPKLHRIEPELQVNNVPVPNPVPVERVVVHTQHVPKPYEVAVPRAVPVPQPYKVHPVQRVVETPVIHKKTTTVHQPVVHTAVAQHVVAQTHVAPVAHAAYAAPVAAAAPIAAAPIAAAPLAAPVAAAAPIAAAPLAGAWAGAAPIAGAGLAGWAGAFPGLAAAKLA